MIQPEKWRETVDPFSLPLRRFKLERVLGYPHAGNDVFYVEGRCGGENCRAFIKVERQAGADIENEVRTIEHIPFSFVPEVLEYSLDAPRFVVTRECPGERLSVILGENEAMRSLGYMEEYGRTLAMLHGLDIPCRPVARRRFFDFPTREAFDCLGSQRAERFLEEHEPVGQSECFVHGDFHYANILWRDDAISAVLDYELSGRGGREFDLAWAVLLRPGQRFLRSVGEIENFLRGYGGAQGFSRPAFAFCYVQAAVHFAPLGDEHYRAELRRLTDEVSSVYALG